MLQHLSTFNRIISRLCLWCSGFGLFLMTVIIGWQVFARYILNDTPHWSEKFCLLLMLYFILFAAAAGVREGTHIGLVFVKDSLPAMPRRVVVIVDHLIVAAFGLGMVWFGYDMVISTWTHTIPTWDSDRYQLSAVSSGGFAFHSLFLRTYHCHDDEQGGAVIWN